MDPITAAIGIAGLGMQLFGSIGAAEKTAQMAGLASQEATISQGITALQGQENDQRQLAMQISARRQQTEVVRKTQMARAQGLAAGVNQTGGTTSSGIQGGQAQATGEGAYNLQGIGQNLSIGESLFGIQRQITSKQVAMAGLQGQSASLQGQASIDSGIGALGGSLMGSSKGLSDIIGNFTNTSNQILDPNSSNVANKTATGGLW